MLVVIPGKRKVKPKPVSANGIYGVTAVHGDVRRRSDQARRGLHEESRLHSGCRQRGQLSAK